MDGTLLRLNMWATAPAITLRKRGGAVNDATVGLSNTLGSAFCAQGPGYNVDRREALVWAHVSIDPARLRPGRVADADFFSA